MDKLLFAGLTAVFLLTYFLLHTVTAMYTTHKETLCIERAKSIEAAYKFDAKTFECTVTTVDGSTFKF